MFVKCSSTGRFRGSFRNEARERDYLDALSAMYADYEKVLHDARVQNYLIPKRQGNRVHVGFDFELQKAKSGDDEAFSARPRLSV